MCVHIVCMCLCVYILCVCLTLYKWLRIYIYVFTYIKLCTLVVLTWESSKYESIQFREILFYTFGFVLIAYNVYALLFFFFLRAEGRSLSTILKQRTREYVVFQGFGQDEIVNSLKPDHFLMLWGKLSESPPPTP